MAVVLTKGALAPFCFCSFTSVSCEVCFYVNQWLIALLGFSLSIGVDVFGWGGYSSASLLLTQQTKQAVLVLVSVSKPLIFNKIQPMSVSAWFASQTSACIHKWEISRCLDRGALSFERKPSSTKLAQRLNERVWSWLRLNAGGMLYTCKSNGNRVLAPLTSGERVSNTSECTQ